MSSTAMTPRDQTSTFLSYANSESKNSGAMYAWSMTSVILVNGVCNTYIWYRSRFCVCLLDGRRLRDRSHSDIKVN